MDQTSLRFRIPFMVWVGLALLAVSLVGIGWGWHLPASAGSTHQESSVFKPMPRSAVSFGFVDVKGGVISLYPLQPGRVVKVECKRTRW